MHGNACTASFFNIFQATANLAGYEWLDVFLCWLIDDTDDGRNWNTINDGSHEIPNATKYSGNDDNSDCLGDIIVKVKSKQECLTTK